MQTTNTLSDITHARAVARLLELTNQIDPIDLTTAELLDFVAIFESAERRLSPPPAPVLRIVPTPDRQAR